MLDAGAFIKGRLRDVRYQYFLTFAVLGTVLPYASVFFRQAGLTDPQIGYAYAIWSVAAMFSPLLVTMVADGRSDPRVLLVLLSVVSGVSLLLLGTARGVGPILLAWTMYCCAYVPILPLQDGIHFSLQRRRLERGAPMMPYHLVRVWGTIGFIVPGILLFGFLEAGMSLRWAMMTGTVFAILAAAQAMRVFDPRPTDARAAIVEAESARRVPTLQALRTLLQPNLIFFCGAVLLMHMAAAIHSAFYPVYLTEKVGLSAKWLGQASNIAVVFEAALIFSCGRLVRAVGTRRLMLIAILATGLRFSLLGASSILWIAIATQVFHGLLIIAISVLPQALLDDRAEDHFRHSMQGVLVMLTNAGRAIVSAAAGSIAASSLSALWVCAAGLCALAAGLVWVGFREPAGAGVEAGRSAASPAGELASPSPISALAASGD